MNYTAEDIEIAKELKLDGFNWIARDKNGYIGAYIDKPYKNIDSWYTTKFAYCSVYKEYFQSITWESEPTSLDSIIASEKPKYERLTDKDIAVTLNTNYCEDVTRFYMYAQRLWELENKIENGQLIFRED